MISNKRRLTTKETKNFSEQIPRTAACTEDRKKLETAS
jgi:hypothetical protein